MSFFYLSSHRKLSMRFSGNFLYSELATAVPIVSDAVSELFDLRIRPPPGDNQLIPGLTLCHNANKSIDSSGVKKKYGRPNRYGNYISRCSKKVMEEACHGP